MYYLFFLFFSAMWVMVEMDRWTHVYHAEIPLMFAKVSTG